MKKCATIFSAFVLALYTVTFHGPVGDPDDTGSGNISFHGPVGDPDDTGSGN